jgi:hypothetical protein
MAGDGHGVHLAGLTRELPAEAEELKEHLCKLSGIALFLIAWRMLAARRVRAGAGWAATKASSTVSLPIGPTAKPALDIPFPAPFPMEAGLRGMGDRRVTIIILFILFVSKAGTRSAGYSVAEIENGR